VIFSHRWIIRYAAAVGAVATAFLVYEALSQLVGGQLPTYITFYPTVMSVALLAGLGPGLLATATAALIADYFLLYPIGQFAVMNLRDAVSLALFTGMGVFMSVVAELYRRARLRAASQEEQIARLDEQKVLRQHALERFLIGGGFILALAILAVIALKIHQNMTAGAQADVRMSHTRSVIQELDLLLSGLQEAETGQRGYLITGREEYLQDYNKAVTQIGSMLDSLDHLTRDDRVLRPYLSYVEPLVRDKLAELKQTIDLRRSRGFQAALAVVSTDRGKAVMDEIRRRIDESRTKEQSLLREHIAAEEIRAGGTTKALIAGGLLSAIILSTVFLFLMRENTRRRVAEAGMLRYQDNLQELVASRTAELARANEQLEREVHEHKQVRETLRQLNAELEKRVGAQTAEIRRTNESLEQRIAERTTELQAANKSLLDSRRATLNLMEDAVIARTRAEEANVELQREVNERKRAERDLEEKRLALERKAAELAAVNKELETFSYSVSHDLRAPIRHIAGFVELLHKNAAVTLDEKNKHYLGVIAESTKLMGKLIDDLLSFSRTGRTGINPQKVDTNELVRSTIYGLGSETRERAIDWDIASLPEVYADPILLKLVWTNLVSNALKFTRRCEKARIEINAEEKNGESIFRVKDNGVGFDMKYQNKLFAIFQRLHRPEDFEGTGIGLANVQRIVHLHGGKVWAEGVPGEGATFYFTIPKQDIPNGG